MQLPHTDSQLGLVLPNYWRLAMTFWGQSTNWYQWLRRRARQERFLGDWCKAVFLNSDAAIKLLTEQNQEFPVIVTEPG